MSTPDKELQFPLSNYDRLCFLKILSIGDGAVIAANTTVTNNVQPYTIVGGNPSKEIKKRFPEEQIKILLEMKWWDWDIAKITENVSHLTGNDLDAFIANR